MPLKSGERRPSAYSNNGSNRSGIVSKSGDDINNPFKMPSDKEVFALRELEKQEKAKERELNKTKKIYEKVKQRKDIKTLLADDEDNLKFYEEIKKSKGETITLPPGYNERMFLRENLYEFVVNKKEMFFLQYSLAVKKNEIEKLERLAQEEENRLIEEEKALDEDAAKFDAYLKENDKSCVEAIRRADQETKAKLEKVQEIKKLNQQVITIKSEIAKNQDQLADLKRYRVFLHELTPVEWFTSRNRKPATNEDAEDDLKSENEDMFFVHPQQLLDIFSDLEENNLSLIQSCQETEETLDELKKKIEETEKRMDRESSALKEQIDALKIAIQKEDEKTVLLEQKTSFFSSTNGSAESQDAMLHDLHIRVKDAYKKCIGENDSSMNTLQMLTAIENKLERLFEAIEAIPPEIVEHAEKLKDKERRQRLRLEKMEAQRIMQEERIKKAVERAKAPVKKKAGKPVVFRSVIPTKQKKKTEKTKAEAEDDLAFYLADP